MNHRATGLRTCYAWDPAADGCGALPAAAAGAAAGLLLGGAAASLVGSYVATHSLLRAQCTAQTNAASRLRALMLIPLRILSRASRCLVSLRALSSLATAMHGPVDVMSRLRALMLRGAGR